MAIGPTVFDRDGPALDIAVLAEPATECGDQIRCSSGDRALRNPISGAVGCCACDASGHAAAAPPNSVTGSRRVRLGSGILEIQSGMKRTIPSRAVPILRF